MILPLAASVVALAVFAAAAVAHQPEVRGTSKAIPITKHSQLVNGDGTVNFDVLKGHVASVQAKILRGLDNFEKNTGTPHPSAAKGLKKHRHGEPLVDYEGIYWHGKIAVGTPFQKSNVLFDTGSSDVVLSKFKPASSSTAHNENLSGNITYGVGSAKVDLYTDTVTVGDLTATGQVIGVVVKSSNFKRPHLNGVIGMAFPSITTFGGSPLFQTLLSDGQLEDPAFSFGFPSQGAELYFGGSNHALYTGDFTYTPVTQQGYWQVNMDGVQGNGRSILKNVGSIIDTGTTLVIGNSSEVKMLYEAVGGQPAPSDFGKGYYTFPCNSPPTIHFTFSGKSFPISPSAFNLGQISVGSSTCVGGIIGSDLPFSSWVVGLVFLQNVYTRFDFGNARVGFAKLA